MKRGTIWALLASAILTVASISLILGILLSHSSGGFKHPLPASTSEQDATRKIKMAVTTALSMPPDDVKISKISESSTDWLVFIDGKTPDVLLVTALSSAHKVFAEIKRTGVPIAAINLLLHTDALRDTYGKSQKNMTIARIQLTGDTFRRINWSRFNILNFPSMATVFWLHDKLHNQWPTLEEIMRQRIQENERMQMQSKEDLFGNGS